METEIIKLYDNEDFDYPLIKIKKGYIDNFKAHLNTYQEKEDYNLEEFLDLLEKFDWVVKIISEDYRMFF